MFTFSHFLLLSIVTIGTADLTPTDEKNNVITLETPNEERVYYWGWLTTDLPHIVFQVKACRNVGIVLSRHPYNTEENAYEVLLGQNSNSLVLIRSEVDGPNDARVEHEDVVDCDDFRPFWISWGGGRLSTGRGYEVGVDQLATYLYGSNLKVTAISFSTHNTGGNWILDRDQFRNIYMRSVKNFDRRFRVTEYDRNFMVFAVRMTDGARLELTDDLTEESKAYVIFLGAEANTETWIRNGSGGKVVAKTHTPNILSGLEFRYFWARWSEDAIEVGFGMRVGERPILAWKHDNYVHPQVVSGYSNKDGDWIFRNHAENSFLLMTDANTPVLESPWVNLEGVTMLPFSVRACPHAVLEFHHNTAEAAAAGDVRVTLGAEDNTQTWITFRNYADNSEKVVKVDTPSLMSCASLLPFYIVWENGRWELVQGVPGAPGTPVFSEDDARVDPRSMRSVYLATDLPGNTAEWEVDRGVGRGVRFQTYSQLITHWLTVADQYDVTFKVLGCEDAEIFLCNYLKTLDHDYYRLVIGGSNNQKVLLYREDVLLVEKDLSAQGGLLDCKLSVQFWVSWRGGVVQFGSGSVVGVLTLLSYSDPPPDNIAVSALGLAVGDMNRPVKWEFSTMSESYTVFTKADAGPTYTMTTVHHVFPFAIKTKSDAVLLLSRHPCDTSAPRVQVKLGLNNLAYIIREIKEDGSSGVENVTDITNGLDENSFKEFWVSWTEDGSTVRVGQGLVGDAPILELHPPTPQPLRAISLASEQASNAEWSFSSSRALTSLVSTDDIYTYEHFWVRDTLQTSVVFRVMACKDAHIFLSPQFSTTLRQAYEVVIGESGNTHTSIRNITQGPNKAVAATNNILNCQEMRPFWVSWANGLIQVGRGYGIGTNPIVDWLDPSPRAVHAISISTWQGVSGQWEFPAVHDELFFLRTSGDLQASQPYAMEAMTVTQTLTFSLDTCGAGSISFQPKYAAYWVYQVKFGDPDANTICIYDAQKTYDPVKEIVYPGLVECGVFRKFWVRWEAGQVEVGSGSVVGYGSLGLYVNVDYEEALSFISFASDTSAHATWSIPEASVSQFNMFSVPGELNWNWFTTLDTAVVFKVKACSDVYITAAENLGIITDRTYQIALKPDDKLRVIIYRNGEQVKLGVPMEFMSCSTFSTLWVQWAGGSARNMVALGQGAIPGLSVITYFEDPNPTLEIRAVALGTGNGVQAEWQIQRLQGETYRIFTSLEDPKGALADPDPYQNLWVIPEAHVTTLSFRVAACSDVTVALSMEAGNTATNTYEVFIGGNGNTLTGVRESVGGNILKSASTPNILSCSEPRKFWISWSDMYVIRVGQNTEESNLIVEVTPADVHPVYALALGVSAGDTQTHAFWEFEQEKVEIVGLRTPYEKSFERMWTSIRGRTRAVFNVKACSEAFVALSHTPGLSNVAPEIEIALTENGESSISEDGQVMDTITKGSILSCDDFMTFWISWEDDLVRVGTGPDVGRKEMLSHQRNTTTTLNAMSVSTSAVNSGMWELSTRGENVFKIFTTDIYNYNRVWLESADNQKRVTFRVRACSDVHVALAETIGQTNNRTYEVVIGGWHNTRTRIRNQLHGDGVVTDANTPNLLDCNNFRRFWVQWYNEKISVGTGDHATNTILNWRDVDDPYTVNFVAFSTGYDYVGEWEIDHRMRETLYAYTGGDHDFEHTWVSVTGRDFLTFKVAACQDAHVALSAIPGVTQAQSYEVIIGGYANSRTAIKNNTVIGSTPVNEVETEGILRCDELRRFWISWRQDTISVGTGNKVLENTLLQWEDPDFHPVRAVGLTSYTVPAEWTISVSDAVIEPTDPTPTEPTQDPGPTDIPDYPNHEEKYFVRTPEDKVYEWFWLTTDRSYFLFDVKACKDITLYLAREPRVVDTNSYEIYLDGWDGVTNGIKRDGQEVITNDSPGYADCDNFKPFWLAWGGRHIRIGEGHVIDDKMIIDYKDDESVSITSVGLSTNWGDHGEWTFTKDSVSTVYAYAHAQLSETSDIWISESQREYLVFGVKVCNDANLLLTQSTSNPENTTVLVLGGWANTRCAVKTGIGTNWEYSMEVADLMSCVEARYFWVSWAGGVIEVGKGTTVGSATFFHWKMPRPHVISMAGIYGWDSGGLWKFLSHDADGIIDNAPILSQTNKNTYVNVDGKQVFEFGVRGCNDAVLAMHEGTDRMTLPTLKLTLGRYNNAQTTLELFNLDTGQNAQMAWNTPSVLSCWAVNRFWLRWTEGRVTLGRYGPYAAELFSVEDPYGPRNYRTIHLGNDGADTEVEWSFSRHAGKAVFFQTTPMRFYEAWVFVTGKRFLTFRVQDCDTARIYLCEFVTMQRVHKYEVRLGYNGNSQSRIEHLDTSKIVEVNTPSILLCYTTQYFWISWAADTINVGHGVTEGERTFITFKDDRDIYDINVASFASGGSELGQWQISEVQGPKHLVITESDADLNTYWLSPTAQMLQFSVRGCRDAVLALANIPGVYDTLTYTVRLGAAGNAKTTITSSTGTQVEADTLNILDCDTMRDFWVSWSLGEIRVGRGLAYDHSVANLTLPADDSDFTVNLVALGAEGDTVAEWLIDKSLASVARVYTTTLYLYRRFWMTTEEETSLTFKVRACNDAHILLAATTNITNREVYEVCLGGGSNTKTWIRNSMQGANQVEALTDGILNCNETRPFWISWAYGHIQIGQGVVAGLNRIIDWQDPDPKAVHALSVATGWGAVGEWEFSNVEDGTLFFNYLTGMKDNIVPAHPYVEFMAQACAGVRVTLAREMLDNIYSFNVIFGAPNSSAIQIVQNGVPAEVVFEMIYPGVTSCDRFKRYWVSWVDDILTGGLGDSTSPAVFQYVLGQPARVTSIGLFTEYHAGPRGGTFAISKHYGKRVSFTTSGQGVITDEMMLTHANLNWIIFQLETCGSAIVSLMEVPGLPYWHSYEFHLGMGTSWNEHNIYKDGRLLIAGQDISLGTCAEVGHVWVMWGDGYLQAGLGVVPGSRWIVLTADPAPPYPVSAVGFTTGDQFGTWALGSLKGNVHSVHTPVLTSGEPEVDVYRSVWITPVLHNHHLSFMVRACKNALIALASLPGDITKPMYEIVIGGADNSKVYIRDGRAGEILAEANTDKILSCETGHLFWVSWFGGHIQVGTGDAYTTTVAEVRIEDAHNVNGVSVSTGDQAEGYWEFPEDEIQGVGVDTVASMGVPYPYWVSVTGKTHYNFNVRACSNVKVSLSSFAGNPDVNAYIFDIQTSSGKSSITDQSQNRQLASNNTEGIVNCEEFRSFWISWEDGILQAGLNTGVGESGSVFLFWKPSDVTDPVYNINAVGLATGGTVDGVWMLGRHGYNPLTFFTSNTKRYGTHWVTLARTHLEFEVRACNDVALAFSEMMGNTQVKTYEVGLGGWGNTGSVIRSSVEGGNEVRVDTPGLLSCSLFRSFWVSWENDELEVGTGKLYDQSFMSISLAEDSYDISSVTFSTGFGATGEFDLKLLTDEILSVETSSTKGFNDTWVGVVGRDYLTFEVMACHDALLALCLTPSNTDMLCYEVIIGGWDNRNSAIRRSVADNYPTDVKVDTPDIMQCDAYVKFWVSWRKGTIEAGYGPSPWQQSFMSHTYSDFFTINSVGFSTGHGANGYWLYHVNDQIAPPDPVPTTQSTTTSFPEYEDDEKYVVYTPGLGQFDRTTFSTSGDYFSFTVYSCGEVQVALSSIPGDVTDRAYRITIGADNNQQSYIDRYESGSSDRQSYGTPGVLPCNQTTALWVSWGQGRVALGSGNNPEQGELARREDSDMFPVTAVSLDSDKDVSVRWEFDKGTARTIQMRTTADLTYRQVWFNLKHQDYMVLHVKVPRDAQISLSTVMENTGLEMLLAEIVLGDIGNTISSIRQERGGSDIVVAETPDILDGKSYRTFWIRWQSGVEVGQGPVVGLQTIMHLKDTLARDVNAVGFTTAKGATGDWRLSSMQGERFTIVTPHDGLYQHAWVYKNHHHFEFHVKACRDASLLLTSTPLNTDPETSAYEILLGGSDNTISHIKRYPNATILTQAWTHNMVDCHSLRPFWVSWFDGHIQVGRGKLFEGEFMEYRDQSPAPVRAVSMKAGQNAGDVEWDFGKELTKTAVLITPPAYAGKRLRWISSGSIPVFRFKVRADSEAHIVLAEFKGVATSNVHEVILGTNNNKKCVILDGINGNEKASFEDPDNADILDTKESRWFWMMFSTEYIMVGRGHNFFGDVILYYNATLEGRTINPVSAIAVSTESTGSSGFWELSLAEDLTIDIITDNNVDYNMNPWIIPIHGEILFQVKSCEDAKIMLADVPMDYSDRFYEVTLGANSNQKVVLRTSEGDSQEYNAPNILDCNTLKDMWISYHSTSDGGRSIRVGSGTIVHEDQIAEFTDNSNAHRVHSIGFKSAHTKGAQWTYPEYAGRVNIFHTQGYMYDHMMYRVAARTFVTFFVKACKDGHVALFDSFNAEEAYEIVIGSSGNQYTLIRNRRLDQSVAHADTPDILSCTEYRPFWVEWVYFRITVGRGLIPGIGEIVSWQDESPTGVTYLSISTYSETEGDWIISDMQDNMNMFESLGLDGNKDNNIVVTSHTTSFTFTIRACAEAIVELHTNREYDAQGYSVQLGMEENSKSFIKALGTGATYAEVLTPDILSCTAPRIFTVTWNNGMIVVLNNGEGGRQIMASEYYLGVVSSVSVRTDHGNRGHWQFGKYVGTSLSVTVSEAEVYGRFWQTAVTRQELVFSVTSCGHVLVLLSQIPGVYTTNTYELAIGEGGKTNLRKEVGGPVVESVDSPGILECNQPRNFWVRWTDGRIEFGTGQVPGIGRMLQWTDDSPYSVFAFGLGTGKDHSGTFQLTQQIGNKLLLYTPDSGDELSFTNIWIAPENDFFTFAVSACQDAHIGLSSDPYNVTGNTYWVTIGGWENSKSRIRIFPKGEILGSHETPNILSCTEFRRFYISWNYAAGRIVVGYNDVGQEFFLVADTPGTMYPINTISLETGWGATGRWEIDHGRVVRVLTEDSYNYQQAWLTTPASNHRVLHVKGCEDARIVLSSELGLLYEAATEIRIQSNGQTSLLSPVDGDVLHEVPTTNVLDCQKMTPLWVSWEDEKIAVGTGTVPGMNPILSYQTTSWHSIRAIGFSGGRAKLEWQIMESAEHFSFKTPQVGTERHWLTPVEKFIQIRVKACQDAHVILSPSFGVLGQDYFQIIFGAYANTYSDIRKVKGGEGSIVSQAPTQLLLSCDEYRVLWVSWMDDAVSAGLGELFSNTYLYYKNDEPLPDVMHTAFRTWQSAVGEWKIAQFKGEYMRVWTDKDSSHSDFGMTQMEETEVVLKVKSCSDVSIALAEIPGQTRLLAYEVVLSNSKSMIRENAGGDILQSADTPAILDCNERRVFWVSWTGGRLAVGKGSVLGQDQLLLLPEMTVELITSLHVSSLTDVQDQFVEWDFVRGNNFGSTERPPTTTTTTSGTTRSSTTTTTTTTRPAGVSTTTPTEIAPGPDGGGLSTGGKVGVALGVIGVALVALLVALVLYTRRRDGKPLLGGPIPLKSMSYNNPAYDSNTFTGESFS